MKILSFVLLCFVANFYTQAQDFETLLAKGDEYYEKADYTEALKYFTKAIKADPKLAKGYEYRGDAYVHLAKYAEAILDFTRCIEVGAQSWHYSKRGECYVKTNKPDLAEADFNKGLGIDDKNEALWIRRGDLYNSQNKKDLACADYQRAFNLKEPTAKQKAFKLGCEWAKLIVKPCQTKQYAIGEVEVEPFTGAIVMQKGINFDKLEIVPEDGDGFVTGPQLGKESIKIKLVNPRNLCADEMDNVFAGIGFSLQDENGLELGKVDDLYKDKMEGLPLDYLKSLSMTLGFEDTTTLKYGKKYLLRLRYFDKRGTAEALVYFPFVMSKNTEVKNSISTSSSSLGIGITGASVEAKVGKVIFQEEGTQTDANRFLLTQNTNYAIHLDGLLNLGEKAAYTYRVIDRQGAILFEEYGTEYIDNNRISLKFSTKKLVPGGYTIWIRIDGSSANYAGMSIPILFK